MFEVRVETDQMQTTLLQSIAISGMLGQDLREVGLAEVRRGQTVSEILPGSAHNGVLEQPSSPQPGLEARERLVIQRYTGTLMASRTKARNAAMGSPWMAATRKRNEPSRTMPVLHGYPQAWKGRCAAGSRRRRVKTAT